MKKMESNWRAFALGFLTQDQITKATRICAEHFVEQGDLIIASRMIMTEVIEPDWENIKVKIENLGKKEGAYPVSVMVACACKLTVVKAGFQS